VSGTVQGCVWDHAHPGDGVAKLVLLCIAEHARDNGHAEIGLRRLSLRTGWGRTAVRQAIARLEDAEYIIRARGDGRLRSAYLIPIFPTCHSDPRGCSRLGNRKGRDATPWGSDPDTLGFATRPIKVREATPQSPPPTFSPPENPPPGADRG